jgi:hypothetical protein
MRKSWIPMLSLRILVDFVLSLAWLRKSDSETAAEELGACNLQELAAPLLAPPLPLPGTLNYVSRYTTSTFLALYTEMLAEQESRETPSTGADDAAQGDPLTRLPPSLTALPFIDRSLFKRSLDRCASLRRQPLFLLIADPLPSGLQFDPTLLDLYFAEVAWSFDGIPPLPHTVPFGAPSNHAAGVLLYC